MNPSHIPLKLLFWETTVGCNLECIHCRRLETSRVLSEKDMTTVQAKAFIDNLASRGNLILVFSGGEPLMRPDIFLLMEYAKAAGLTTALATNGTMIDQRTAECIKKAGVERVSISLDGAVAETHDRFRRQDGAFNKALEGFRLLKNEGMSMQINTTVTKHNKQELEQIYRMAYALAADALHFFMLVPVGCGLQIADTNRLEADEYEVILNWIYEISKEKKIFVRTTCAPHYFRVVRQRAKQEGRSFEGQKHGYAAMTKGCLAGTGIAFVSHQGDVFPCGYLPLACGNVKKEAFWDVFDKSSTLARFRQPELLGGKCGICEYKNVCSGCRARAYYQTGDFLSEEPLCAYEPKRKVLHSKS